MKKRVFSILGAAAAAFLLFAGCQMDNADGGSEKSNAAKIEDAVKELNTKFKEPLKHGDTLPTKSGDVSIEWQRDDEYIENGKVKAPTTTDAEKAKTPKDVTFKAKLTCGGETKEQKFTAKIKYRLITQEEQDAAKALDEAIRELKSKVTEQLLPDVEKIELPNKAGEYDVTWKAEPEDIINTKTGAVTHKEGTESDTVKLTATLKKGDKTAATMTFYIKVFQKSFTVTDKTRVDAAMADLKLPEELPDGKTLDLPASENGVSISWKSETPEVFNDAGVPTRPNSLTPVEGKLTATFTKGDETKTKTYTIKVYPADATVVQLTKNALTLERTVISDNEPALPLPQEKNGVSITWTSGSAAAVIEGDKAKRGKVQGSSENVTLTAALKKGTADATQTFTIRVFAPNVQPSEPSDTELLEAAEKTLKASIKAEVSSPTDTKLELKKDVPVNGRTVKVTWLKSEPDRINLKTGEITFPTLADGKGPTHVKLTAQLKAPKGEKKDVSITVIVKHKAAGPTPQNPAKDVADALAELQRKVSQEQTIADDKPLDFIKEKTIGNGVSVAWKSSDNTTINETTGAVKRPEGAEGKTVTLTATLSKAGATPQTYKVTVTVKGKAAVLTDEDLVKVAASKLTLPTESKNGQAITLPKPDPADGVAVTWKSRNTNVIKDDGTVVPPPAPKPVDVKLTATLKKGSAEKPVIKTVKVFPTDFAMAKWAAGTFTIQKTAKHDDTIKLPVELIALEGRTDKASVRWTAVSAPTGIIDTGSGKVNAPSKQKSGAGPTKVKLIAECQVGEKKATHDYEVSVEHRDATADEIVEEAFSKFDLKAEDKDVRSPKNKIDLPTKLENDVTISWTVASGANDVIGVGKDNLGKITYKESAKPKTSKVTLKATFSKAGATNSPFKTFEITVHHKVDPSKALDDAVNELEIAQKEIKSDDDLTLPEPDAAYGVTVTWTSSSGVIAINGEKGAVKRPYGIGSEKVTLTATGMKDGKTKSKTFDLTVTYRNDGAWRAFKEDAVSAVKLELSKTGEGGIDKEKVVADVTGTTAKDWEAGINHPYSFNEAGIYLVRFTVTAPAASTGMRFSVHMEDGNRDLASVPFTANTTAAEQSYLVYVDNEAKGKNASLSLSLKTGKTTVEKVAVEYKNAWGTDHDGIKAWNFWNSKATSGAAVAASGVTATGITLHEWVGKDVVVSGADVGVEYAAKAMAAGKKYVQFKVGADIETVKLLGKDSKAIAICDMEDSNKDTLCYFEVDVKDADKAELKIQFLPKPVTGGANGTEKTISIADVALKDALPAGATKLTLRTDPVKFSNNWTVLTGGYDVPNKDVYAVSASGTDSITLRLDRAAEDVSGRPYIKLTYAAGTLESGKKYNVTYDLTGMEKPWTQLVDKDGNKCKVNGQDGAMGNLRGAVCATAGNGFVELYPKAVGTYSITNMQITKVAVEGKLDNSGIIGDIAGGWKTSDAKELTPAGDGKTYTFDFQAEKHTVFWKLLVNKDSKNDVFGGPQSGEDLEVKVGEEKELQRGNNAENSKACKTDVEGTAKYRLTLKVTEAGGNISKVTAKIEKIAAPTSWLLDADAYVKTAIKRFKGESADSGDQKTEQRKLKNPTKAAENERVYAPVMFMAEATEHEFEISNGSDTWKGGSQIMPGDTFTELANGGSTAVKVKGLRVGSQYELKVKTFLDGSTKKLSVNVKEPPYATIKFKAVGVQNGVGEVFLNGQNLDEPKPLAGSNDGWLPWPIKSWNSSSGNATYTMVKEKYPDHFANVTSTSATFAVEYRWYYPSDTYNFTKIKIIGCKKSNGDGEKDNGCETGDIANIKVPSNGSGTVGKTYTVTIKVSDSSYTITEN